MKKLLLPILAATLFGCSATPPQEQVPLSHSTCVGSTKLPAGFNDKFTAIEDEALLNDALGEAKKGKLCQGLVYQSKNDTSIVIYRAWNSTNPNSKMGQWWAFEQPIGKVAKYRSDYEICYQWSPLDQLVRCSLKPGTKVVVGTGQSAECSQYLTYPASDKQQIRSEVAPLV